jgi:transposase
MSAERERLRRADADAEPWRRWGPYLPERQWGTVREDYGATGSPWEAFPHDYAAPASNHGRQRDRRARLRASGPRGRHPARREPAP